MISRALSAVALAALCLGPALAQEAQPEAKQEAPAEVREFLKAWAKAMDGVKSLRVEFTQTKKLKILRRPLVSKGVTLMKGRRVLMVVEGKDGRRETELLVDGKEAKLHYPKQKRVEVFPLGQDRGRGTPFLLFGGDLEALPETYRIRLEAEDGLDVLVLTPRDEGSPIKETRMRFRDHTVVAMEQLTRRGDRLSLEVHAFEKNPEVDDAELELKLAEGTKVVRSLEGKR